MVLPVHGIVFAVQNLLNFLNFLIIAYQEISKQQNHDEIPPLPDVLNLLVILLNALEIIWESYERNWKVNKIHLLIKFLRGYRLQIYFIAHF